MRSLSILLKGLMPGQTQVVRDLGRWFTARPKHAASDLVHL